MRRWRDASIRTCSRCAVAFLPWRPKQMFCSSNCQSSAYAKTHREQRASTLRKYRAGHPELYIWSQIKNRCVNERSKHWRYYGARGIRMCREWRENPAAFLAHVGPRPSSKHSIDRIDNDRGYEPGNVRWATRHEQMQNTRATKLSASDVRFIRHWCRVGYAVADIANAFSVTTRTVYSIRAREVWPNA